MAVELKRDNQESIGEENLRTARNTLVYLVDYVKKRKREELDQRLSAINSKLNDNNSPVSRLENYGYTAERFIIQVVRESLNENSPSLFAAVRDYCSYRTELCATLAAQKLVQDKYATGLHPIIHRYIPVNEFDAIILRVQTSVHRRSK